MKKKTKSRIITWSVAVGAIGLLVGLVLAGSANEKKKEAELEEAKASLELNVPSLVSEQGFFAVDKNGAAIPLSEANQDAVRFEMVFDPHCGACHMVETAINDSLRTLMESGEAQLYFTPVSFMNQASSDDYSARAASALMTVVEEEPERFFDFFTALYENFPPEGAGYKSVSYEQIGKWALDAGVSQSTVDKFEDETYRLWSIANTEIVNTRTELFPGGSVTTPSIFVGGKLSEEGALSDFEKISFQSSEINADFVSEYERITGQSFPK